MQCRFQKEKRPSLLWLVLSVFIICAFLQQNAEAFTLNVFDANNNPVTGFRWLLEEDNTNHTVPGAQVANSISLDIHNSHAPVISKGTSGGSTATIPVPNPAKYYFVSVLPDSVPVTGEPRYTLSSAIVAPGQSVVNVYVNALPIPTAQISLLVFKDHNPINNAPDAGEPGISGIRILVFDQGGQMSQDAFGNPLGTTYDGLGGVVTMGTGEIVTGPDGTALIKYLAPGKYGIRAVIPAGMNWVQTSTIEGTLGIDAWVKANEPPFSTEGFGPGFYHVFIGFVEPATLAWNGTPPEVLAAFPGRSCSIILGDPR